MSRITTDQRAGRRAQRSGDPSRSVPIAVGVVIASAIFGAGDAVLAGGPASGAPDVAFDRAVRPILSQRCVECHSEADPSSGFSIASRATIIAGGEKYRPAVVAGDPARSPLVRVLRGSLKPRMPLRGKLNEDEIARVEDWIRNLPPEPAAAAVAAPWRWPFERPAKPRPPAVRGRDWVITPIDAFVLKRLEEAGLNPAPSASKPMLARRVYLDLIGLPPTPEELAAFLADDSPVAYPRLIDRLLADPRYGERWGRHWLDLARYGETSGLEGDGAIGNAWRYRDWVIEAFNRDLPYDRFVIQQLAGADEHSKTRLNYQPDIQGHIPTGFLRLAPWDRSNLVAEEVRQNYLNEVTEATGSVFLGLTIGCAQCHDHKYDPIPTRDFYRFQAFFNATQAVKGVEVPYRDPAFAARARRKIRQAGERLRDGPEKRELDTLLEALRRRWIAGRRAAAKGRPPTTADLRLELKRGESSLFAAAVRQEHAALLEAAKRTGDPDEEQALEALESRLMPDLIAAYARPGVDPLARFEALTVDDVEEQLQAPYSTGSPFRADEQDRYHELSSQLEVIRRRMGRWNPVALTVDNVPGPPNGPGVGPTHVLIRGDYRNRGVEVKPGFPSALTGHSRPAVIETDRYRQFPTRGWRMTLAKWIASPDNPLTARVMVNRIWQHHLGRGIVGTPSDFGTNGERPTHPELLDWLAHAFVESGWSIKAMHRLILLSSTYRQASENPGYRDHSTDPDDRLLGRFPRHRLEAEVIRDSILAISGRLNGEMGGPSIFPPLPEDLADFARYGRTGGLMWEPNETEADGRRRSIYIFQRRSLPLPMMAAFDAPAFSESCPRRTRTTTPLQALAMMNGSLVQDGAAALAGRIRDEVGDDRRAQVVRGFERVLNRGPDAAELAAFVAFRGPLEGICRVLFASDEFLYLD